MIIAPPTFYPLTTPSTTSHGYTTTALPITSHAFGPDAIDDEGDLTAGAIAAIVIFSVPIGIMLIGGAISAFLAVVVVNRRREMLMPYWAGKTMPTR